MTVLGYIENGKAYPVPGTQKAYVYNSFSLDTATGTIMWYGPRNPMNFMLAEQWLRKSGYAVVRHVVGRLQFPASPA